MMPYDPKNRYGSRFSRIYWQRKFKERKKKENEKK
jgi:hypothetical protein